ncbi:hypothetical protein L218DRAFT_1008513 [Marasmius fiardii PR-910]|nr:hypothetical protein L218DRAFT_1008513 [Marasmius fiardii PR-910]
MTDEDGNTCLFCLAETTNDDSENERSSATDDSGDDQIWARYDDASSKSDSKNDHEHSPDSYGGSQYTSDSEPDERTSFMLDYDTDNDSEFEDYTNIEIPEQFAGVWDDSDSESEYESCLSEPNEVPESEDTHLKLDYGEFFHAIQVKDNGDCVATVEPKLTHSPTVGRHPKHTNAEKRCLAGWIELNSLKAFTLFDSGSTADATNPDFIHATKLKIFCLENLVTL